MLGQLNFEKSEKYAKKLASNLTAYTTGQSGKRSKVALKGPEIKDPQIQTIFFIGAGLWLVEEDLTLKGRKSTRKQRERAVKELFSDLYSGTAQRLLESRSKVVEVKNACLELQRSELPQEASFQAEQLELKKKLEDLQQHRVSNCGCLEDAKKCKNALKKTLDCLQKRGAPRNLASQLEKRIETQIKGLYFYIVYRYLWREFEKPSSLHNSKKKFQDALNACENAYVRMENIFQAEKAAAQETEENLEKNRRDEFPDDETTRTPTMDEKIQSLPSEEIPMREEEEAESSRTTFIQVKSIEPAPELERQETISSREEESQIKLARLERELGEKNAQLEDETRRHKEDLRILTEKWNALSNDKKNLEAKLSSTEEWAKKLQSNANEDKDVLQKEIQAMRERHQIECNELKAEVKATASDFQKLQRRLYEEAQKRLAENSQVEQLSDPNRPSEIAKRYGDLFQKTYDVAEVLEASDIDEDDCNSFIVKMLIISSKAAKTRFAEYVSNGAEIHGLSEPFLKNNQTAKRTLRESITSLLRLASATRKKEDSEYITRIALEEVKKRFPKYHVQETASAIGDFLISASPITWEVAISLRETDFVLDDKTFDEALHERFTGSDPEATNVKFIVWPRLAERFTGKTLCKGRVVTGV